MVDKESIKVLHILNELCFSGAEVMLHDAREFFEEAGITTTLLSTGDQPGPYTETLKACDYNIAHIPFAKNISFFFKLYKVLKKNKFDAIHIHPERAYFYYALVARLASRAKLIRTYHDVFFHYAPHKKLIRRIQRLIARTLFSVTGVSIGDSVQKVEMDYFGNPSEIIYNWIDEVAFRQPSDTECQKARSGFGVSEEDLVFCLVGTCNEKKRHKDIFDAIAEVKSDIPAIKLLHRGTGPDTEEEKEYVRKIGIEDNVIFLDYIDFLPMLYWASDCFIFASKWEGLGDVIIEAIACGLPVILYDGLGMRDFKPLPEESFGYWLDLKTGRFADAIRDFAKKTSAERLTMKQNARKLFTSKFSMKKSLGRLVSIYKGI